MNSVVRLILLGLFAACGGGLALCVGWTLPTSEPSPAPAKHLDAAASPDARAMLGTKKIAAAKRSDPLAPVKRQLPRAQASRERRLPPSRPILAEPAPPITQQVRADREPGVFQLMWEELRQTMQSRSESPLAPTLQPGSPIIIHVAAAPALPSPASPALSLPARDSEPPETEFVPQHQPTAAEKPNDDRKEPTPAEMLPASPASKNRIARVEGEGDDHLSIHIQDTDIREVLELLSEQGGMNILPSASVQGKISASLTDVNIDTAMSAILKSTGYVARREGNFVYVGTNQDFQALEQSLDRLGTRIYRPNYVRAAELQVLISPLLTQGVGAVSVSSPAEVGIPADNVKAGGDGFAGGDALLIRDYEAVLDEVDQVIAEIDQQPLQVAIEAMILSVKLDDEHQCGVDFQALRQQANVRIASGSPLGDIADVNFSDGGMKFGFLDSSMGAFVTALETIGDTNVIATPRLTCLNKHRAEILIGAQLGYISTTVTETSTAQSVEFLEVGTQLRIRPFISPDGNIRMEVHPELSTGSVQLKGEFTLPEKEVTQVTTNIMVRDGCTVIIGGLQREDLSSTASQLPVLGNIPGIGFLFRQTKETIERREILVLLTPHIIGLAQACCEGDAAACDFKNRQAVYSDHMSPLGKRHIGKKYFRLAEQAWSKCDKERALRMIDLSIHFDPLNQDALKLQDEILAGNGSIKEAQTGSPLTNSLSKTPETEELPPWIVEDLSGVSGPQLHKAQAPQPAKGKTIQRRQHFE